MLMKTEMAYVCMIQMMSFHLQISRSRPMLPLLLCKCDFISAISSAWNIHYQPSLRKRAMLKYTEYTEWTLLQDIGGGRHIIRPECL